MVWLLSAKQDLLLTFDPRDIGMGLVNSSKMWGPVLSRKLDPPSRASSNAG